MNSEAMDESQRVPESSDDERVLDDDWVEIDDQLPQLELDTSNEHENPVSDAEVLQGERPEGEEKVENEAVPPSQLLLQQSFVELVSGPVEEPVIIEREKSSEVLRATRKDSEIAELRAQVQSLTAAMSTLYSAFQDGEAQRERAKSTMEDVVDLPSVGESLSAETAHEFASLWRIAQRAKTPVAPSLPVISFMKFQVGDVALFMPAFVDSRSIWMAFNSGCPHYFLSNDSLLVFLSKSRHREGRSSIIGRLIFIETRIAQADNEYRLPVGMEYHICHAEPLYRHNVLPHGAGAKKTLSGIAAAGR